MELVLKSKPEITKGDLGRKRDNSRHEKEITCLWIWVCEISEPLEEANRV